MVKKGKIRGRLLYACYLVIITIAAMEVLLRFYYPFQRKIRGDKWKLSTNIVYELHNDHQPRLDKTVINRRNAIGFRGEDPSPDIGNRLTILTVGGSTTACTFLTEGKTWTDKLVIPLRQRFPSVWVNNAGLDGHSTYGNLNFIYYYLPSLSFKPNVIVFLIGANDVDRADLGSIDSSLNGHPLNKVRNWFENNSETINFFRDLKWSLHPVDIFKDDPHWSFTNFKTIHLADAYIDSALKKQGQILLNFKKRLYRLVEICRRNEIVPVFVTQPSVFGDGSLNGGNPDFDFHVYNQNENGQLFWKKLELFNGLTSSVSAEEQIHCIDLANLLPRDTLYYYDMIHFTNAGAERVSQIIFADLNQYLSDEFPQYLKH